MGACSPTRVVAKARQLALMELEPTHFGSSGNASLGRGSLGRVMRGQKVSAIKRHAPARRRVFIIFCTSAPRASQSINIRPPLRFNIPWLLGCRNACLPMRIACIDGLLKTHVVVRSAPCASSSYERLASPCSSSCSTRGYRAPGWTYSCLCAGAYSVVQQPCCDAMCANTSCTTLEGSCSLTAIVKDRKRSWKERESRERTMKSMQGQARERAERRVQMSRKNGNEEI